MELTVRDWNIIPGRYKTGIKRVKPAQNPLKPGYNGNNPFRRIKAAQDLEDPGLSITVRKPLTPAQGRLIPSFLTKSS